MAARAVLSKGERIRHQCSGARTGASRVHDDGTEFLHIKMTLKNFQNKPLLSDVLYYVIGTRDDTSLTTFLSLAQDSFLNTYIILLNTTYYPAFHPSGAPRRPDLA